MKAGDKLVMLNGEVVKVAKKQLFGHMAWLSGTAIAVEHNGQEIKANGFDIDAAETEKRFAAENKWEANA